jgi:hypothetical protein
MKSNVIRLFLALGAVCVSGTVLQAQSGEVTAKIPFAFQVANKTFQSGKYTVGQYGNTGIQTIKSATTGEGVFLAGANAVLDLVGSPRLVFHCYGTDGCFLAEIWPATGRGSAVPMTKTEKEIVNGERPREMAKIIVDLHRAD